MCMAQIQDISYAEIQSGNFKLHMGLVQEMKEL